MRPPSPTLHKRPHQPTGLKVVVVQLLPDASLLGGGDQGGDGAAACWCGDAACRLAIVAGDEYRWLNTVHLCMRDGGSTDARGP